MGEVKKKAYEKKWCFFPMFVSESPTGDEFRTNSEEDDRIWEKYDTLSSETRDILTTPELAEAIYDFSQARNLVEAESAFMSLATRKFYFHEWALQECGNNIYQFFSRRGRDADTIREITEDFQRKILSGRPKADDVSVASSSDRLALVPALGKYPRLGEQQITKERIRVKNQPEPVRPSLANWIRVYRDELGVGYHEPMVRGKFLFDSENGKHLTSEDRERLNLVLRSIEENVTLEIDTDKPEIVFPEFVPASKKPVPVPQPVIVSRPEPPRVAPVSASVPHENRPVSQVPAPVAPPIPVAPVRNPLPSGPVPPAPNPRPAPVQDASFASRPPVRVAPAPQIPPQAPPRRPVSFSPAPPSNLPIGNPESPIGIPVGNANVASGISFSRPTGMTPSVESLGEVGSQAAKGNGVAPARLSPATPPSVFGGSISFSSSHSLPVESDDRKGEFSIRKQDVQPLPSGRNAFGAREERNETSIPSSKPSTVSSSPASDDPHAQPAANANPFRIHPVSFHDDLPDRGVGKIVS